MALFDWLNDGTQTTVAGDGVVLRPPVMADYPAWAQLRAGSRAYLQPWEPTWPEDDLTRPAFRRRLSIYDGERERGAAWPFFVFREDDGRLVGAITLSNIRRGVAMTGTLGYWIGRPYAGRGHATAAVAAVCGWTFDTLGLHRIEAACLPENLASRRVLEKASFDHEGLARAYLKINGAWADHMLFGRVNAKAEKNA